MSAPQVVSVLEVAQEVTESDAMADSTEQCAQVEPEVLVVTGQMSPDPQSGFPGPPPLHGPTGQNDGDDTGQTNGNSNSDPLRDGQCLSTNTTACNGPTDKKGRRVVFPTGERIVSGFTHPPSPWNDVSTCSTDDLIGAYRRACELHGVKAIPKLLQQLMAITNFCDRNETLTLRGERLDARHCETMEEVLRRVQFRTIDLESCHLEEDGATALFDMIEYYESCTKLNISYNKTIGVRGWQSCARMMKKTPCLEYLEARGCTISDHVMPFIGRSIRLGSQLTTLHLENAIMSGRPLMILVAAIKMNDILRELFLADNKLMPSDGIQLGNLLKFNHRLRLLDLRNNHLQDVGVSHIADGMWEQNLGMGLNTLVLWNNSVTYQSMISLSRSLMNTKSLETLNLGHNNITNEGIYRLKEGLLNNKSLLRIGLQAAKISDEGAVALAEYIAESPRLLRMDLRENDIKTGGLMALSLSLKVSESVTRIDLDKEPKKDSAMKDYIEQQRRLQNDIINYTTRNKELAWRREEEEERRRVEEEKAHEEAERQREEEERMAEELADQLAEELAQAAQADDAADQEKEADIDEEVFQEEATVQQVSPPTADVQQVSLLAADDQQVSPPAADDQHVSPPVADDQQVSPPAAEDQQVSPPAADDQQVSAVVPMDTQVSTLVLETSPQVVVHAAESEISDKDYCRPSPQLLKLHFNLPLAKTQTLESPAFVSAAELPLLTPPPDKNMKDLETVAAIAASLQTPADFPPSPMITSDGRTILAAIPENPPAMASEIVSTAAAASPPGSPLPCPTIQTSPNTRRKFIISRVTESPAACKPEKPFHMSEPTSVQEQGQKTDTTLSSSGTNQEIQPTGGIQQQTEKSTMEQNAQSTTDQSDHSDLSLCDSTQGTGLTSSRMSQTEDTTESVETPGGATAGSAIHGGVEHCDAKMVGKGEDINQSESLKENGQSGQCKVSSIDQSGQSEIIGNTPSNSDYSSGEAENSSDSRGNSANVMTEDLCVEAQIDLAGHVASAEQVKVRMVNTENIETGSCDKANGNMCDSSGPGVSGQKAPDSALLTNQDTDNNSNIDLCAVLNTGSGEFGEIPTTGNQRSVPGGTGAQTRLESAKGVDFHSNLTMNGMKSELATAVMDSFEKELNDLDLHLELDKIDDEAETASEKTMEDILAEAVGEL